MVTGSNPVEILTFSGFLIRCCIIAFITTRIIAYLMHLFVLLKSLHLKFRYIPTICLVVEVCLIVPTHILLFLLTRPCPPVKMLSLETKFIDYDTFWTPKAQLLRICSSVLLNLFSLTSHCETRIFALLERKSEEATIAGHPLGVGSLWISTYFFFITLLHIVAVY